MNSKAAGTRLVFKSFLLALGAFTFGCTGDGNGLDRQTPGHAKTELSSTAPAANCVEQLTRFDRVASLDPIEANQLPAGLLLYSSADVLIQSKSKPETLLVAREVPSSQGVKTQVSCSSTQDSEPVNLDATIKGLTKIEISSANRVTVRQFQAYMNGRNRGMVSLNPRLQARPIKDLSSFLAQAGGKARFFKLGDDSYALLTEREEGDSRVALLITYEHVNHR